MSPARIIDIRGILLHVEWRFSERRSLSGGGLSSPSPEGPGQAFPQASRRHRDRWTRDALAGQLVVFTGKLSSLGRREARALVTRLGGDTADDVNARTTMLVVGAEGFRLRPGGDQTSNKLKRAEELNAGGAPRSDRHRGRVLPARRRADGADAEAAVPLDARSARALPRCFARITCAIW